MKNKTQPNQSIPATFIFELQIYFSAALKDEQLAIMKRMKKKEKDNDFLEEREMFQLEYDVQELEDQKQVLEYTRRTSVSNAAAIRALFANDEKLNNNL